MCPRQSKQQQLVYARLRAHKIAQVQQAIWPKSKDLLPTYLKATQPISILRQPQSNH